MSDYWIHFFISLGLATGIFIIFVLIFLSIRKAHDNKLKDEVAKVKEIENKFKWIKFLSRAMIEIGLVLLLIIPWIMTGFNSKEILKDLSEDDWNTYAHEVKNNELRTIELRDSGKADIFGASIVDERIKDGYDYDDIDELIDELKDEFEEENGIKDIRGWGTGLLLLGIIISIIYSVYNKEDKENKSLQDNSYAFVLIGLMCAYLTYGIAATAFKFRPEDAWGSLLLIAGGILLIKLFINAYTDILWMIKSRNMPEYHCSRCNYIIPYNKRKRFLPKM